MSNCSSGSAVAYEHINLSKSDLYYELEDELNRYDFILSFYNYCYKIKPIILDLLNEPKDRISDSYINSYVFEIKDYLVNLFNDKSNMLSDALLVKIYEIIYYLIELEIVKNGKSTLYDFLKDEKIDTRYINLVMCNKINTLKSSSNLDKNKLTLLERLKRIIPKLNLIESDTNYFQMEIIKLLLMIENKNYNVYEELEQEFNSKYDALNPANASEVENKYNDNLNKLPLLKEKLKKDKKALINKVISTLLSASIIITGGIGIERGVRKASSTNSFIKESEITSLSTGDTTTKKEEYLSSADVCPDKTYINILSPWQNNDDDTISRNVEEYDVSYSDLSKYDDLNDVDFDSLGIEPNYYTETISGEDMLNVDKYNGNIKELSNVKYKYNGPAIKRKKYIISLTLIYFMYIVILSVGMIGMFSRIDYAFFMSTIKEFIESKKEFELNNEQIEECIKILTKYINDNDRVRSIFNILYKENIELLSDEEELKNRLKSMIYELDKSHERIDMTLSKKLI